MVFLIMVYIKLNVILHIGLQIPGDLFAAGQLLSVPARVRVPLCQTTEAKSLSQPKESIQLKCSAFYHWLSIRGHLCCCPPL